MTAAHAIDVACEPPRVRAGWEHLHAHAPVLTATISNYLDQIAVSLRPATIDAVNADLFRFARFLHDNHSEIVARA